MNLKKLGEFGFISQMARQHPPFLPSLQVGIGDDACVWQPSSGCQVLATCDLLIENIHFSLKTTTAWALGAKALAASLSDIAAMGGQPRLYLISLSIPKRAPLDSEFFNALYDGMQAWGTSFGASLAGGDTTASPGPLVIDVMVLGEVEKGRALLRSGARPGDLLFCTGTLGDSAAGLACLQLPQSAKSRVPSDVQVLLTKRHLLPQPRYLVGRWLSTHRAATACIDISDGLSSEVNHLAQASGVGFELEAEKIPLSPALRVAAKALKKNPLSWALHGGEDYELLFTLPPQKAAKVLKLLSRQTGSPITFIGKALPKTKGLRLRSGNKSRPLQAQGYDHFAA